MKLYRVRLRPNGLFVRMWVNQWMDFEWSHIFGVQIGAWFVGAVRGEVATRIEAASSEPPQQVPGAPTP